MSCPSLVVRIIPLGDFQANCTIVGNKESGNYIMCDVSSNATQVVKTAQEIGLNKCIAIYFTHGHFDHISGATEAKQLTEAPIYIHQDDVNLYNDIEKQCKFFGIPKIKPLSPVDKILNDGDTISIDNYVGNIMHVPGHSPGSTALYFKDQNLLIGGDVLFKGSYGRTDLWGGNGRVLKQSITKKLFQLPSETTVITGHGPSTTIGAEKRTNMILFM
ncbi:Beta lactamase domain [Entamoeba marina]